MSRNGESARLIEAAGDLGPTIAGMRDKIEQERRLPPALVEQLRDLGFFSLWLPREFGGPALSLSDFVRVVEAVSRLDGSVGWCVTNAGMYSMFAGLLPESVARARSPVPPRAHATRAVRRPVGLNTARGSGGEIKGILLAFKRESCLFS